MQILKRYRIAGATRRTVFALVVMMTIVGMASASPLVGTVGNGGALSDLYNVDPLTGAMTLIGNVGYAVNGMDYYNGILYGLTSWHDPNFHGLITIDTTTGVGTAVGTGWGATLPDMAVADLAIDSLGNAFGWSEPGTDDLIGIDLTTGLLTGIVGEAGLTTSALGLAFDNSDDLFLVIYDGSVYDVNAGTGATSLVGSIGVTAHHGDVDIDTGIYYGLENPWEGSGALHSADLASATLYGSVTTDHLMHTLAFLDSSDPVPEPATIGLLGMGLAGLAARMRKKKAA